MDKLLNAHREKGTLVSTPTLTALPVLLPPAGFGRQLLFLLRRNLQLLVYDPILYTARGVMLAFIIVFFAIVYVDQVRWGGWVGWVGQEMVG